MGRQYGTNSISSEEAHAYVDAERRKAEAARLRTERVLGIVIAVVGIVFLGLGIFRKSQGPRLIAQLDAQVKGAQETLAEKVEFNESGGTIKYVDPVLSSGKECGESVCRLQNQLIVYDNEFMVRRYNSADPGRESMSDEHQACLVEFRDWIDDSSGMSGSQRGNFSIWSYYGTWVFAGTFDYAGDDFNIVWKCYDDPNVEDPVLLVVMMAHYSAYSNTLTNLTRYITPAYRQRLARDYLRNSDMSIRQELQELQNYDDGTLPYDQGTDISAGPPSGLTNEEYEQWIRDHESYTHDPSGPGYRPEQEQEGGGQQDDSGGQGVQQWTTPSGTQANDTAGLTIGGN